jgi:hypothetical protein
MSTRPPRVLVDVEYKVDYARSHVHAAIEGLADKDVTREWVKMRLEQADELLTAAVQQLWDDWGWGPMPIGTAADQRRIDSQAGPRTVR